MTITITLVITTTSIATGTGTTIVQAWLSLCLSLPNLSGPQLKHKLNSAPFFLPLLRVKSPMVGPALGSGFKFLAMLLTGFPSL